jgi:hypothetical protein
LQNIDYISASFSNLGITTFIAENKGLTAQEAPIVHTFSKSNGVQRPFPFLDLPWPAKQRVYTHLRSKDCIALSSTCHQMYKLNTFSYTHLQFLPPNSLFSLAHSVCQLGAVLACSPRYAEAVRSIRIVGWTTSDVPEGLDREAVYDALDKGIASLLEHARHIYSLTLDLNLTKTFNYFPKTLTALVHVRTIRDLCLTPFYPPTYTAESSSPALNVGEYPPAYEQVFLNVCSSGWLPIMMRDPRKLRWFALSMADKDRQTGDANWALTLQRVAEAATELETLVLSGGQHFDADILGQTLRIGFVRGSALDHSIRSLITVWRTAESRGSWEAPVHFCRYEYPQPRVLHAALLWLLWFLCHAHQGRRQPLRKMAPRFRPSVRHGAGEADS